MGYYIETPQMRGKADFIVGAHGARRVTREQAEEALAQGDGVVCVVDNVAWEAAGFIYSANEFRAFTDPNDFRPRTWLVMDLAKAKQLSGYQN